MRVRFVVLLGILLTLSATLAAQQHRDSMTVEVVDVPVYVTRGGTPLEGLTRDDFELYVNGRRQPIEYFDSLSAAAPAASLSERRLFLLLFDVVFSHPHSLMRAQRAAAEVIARSAPGDYFAVATYSARRGVWFAVPFTRNRAALTRAVASLNHSRSGDPLSIVMTASERATFERWSESGGLAPDSGSGNLASRIAAETLRDLARARAFRAAEEQVLDLGELAERLTPLEGEKHVVILSEGFDGRTPNPFDIRIANPRQWDENGVAIADPFGGRAWDHQLGSRLLRMHRDFQRANVLLHGVDLEGAPNTLMSNDALNWMAKGTGGHFITGRNDLSRAMTDLSVRLARGYRLGFRPTSVRRGYNSVEVKVRAPRGVRVNHRQGFFATPPSVDVNDGIYLADILLNDVPQSGTAARLDLRGRSLTVRVPMRELVAQLPNGGTADLLLYAFDAGGTALLYHRETIPVTENTTGERVIELTVPEGTRVAKALLRIDGSLGFSKVGG